jgi:hypothetical protein
MQAVEKLTTVEPLRTLAFGACSRKDVDNNYCEDWSSRTDQEQLYKATPVPGGWPRVEDSINVVSHNAGPVRLLSQPLY